MNKQQKNLTTSDDEWQFESKEEFDAHAGLFLIVDDLFDKAPVSTFMDSISDALFAYLQTEGLQIGADATKEQIRNLLDLNLFIATLSEQLDHISAVRTNLKLKREVSNG